VQNFMFILNDLFVKTDDLSSITRQLQDKQTDIIECVSESEEQRPTATVLLRRETAFGRTFRSSRA